MSDGNKPSGSVLVAGAGIAGMQAALDLAAQGFAVHLVEKNISIGGVMAQLDKTFPTNDCSTCMISPRLIEVAANPNITIHSRAKVKEVAGQAGAFEVTVEKEPRFIDLDKCTGCGDCAKVCPIDLPADFNQGLNTRKAIYRHFPQAVPAEYAIDKAGQSPCKIACPAGIAVQGYVGLIAQGRFKEALEVIRRDNPLPGVCGRVCTHPCEVACQRGEVDEPIAIRYLKRFVTDWEVEQGEMNLPEVKPDKGVKVAIIGSGPAGLTAAYYLALEGYRPTIFEALPVAGGMLRVGIPDYRLPPEVLDYEIEYIKKVGVEIKLNTPFGPFGDSVTLDSLAEDGYQAVFLAIGAHDCFKLGLPGEDELEGVTPGIDFLREAALGRAEKPGEKVAVIGGGNVAMDAARTALRLGSKEVTILYRRTRAEMPAYEEEIEEALEEGINIEYLVAPVRFVGQDGKLTGIEVIKMELGPADASGRRRPQPIQGSEYIIEVDGAIPAIGQEPDISCLDESCQLDVVRGNCLTVDPVTLQTNIPHVFAGGDVVSGPATAIEAIAWGKEAAESIRRFLEGEDLHQGRDKDWSPAKPDIEGIKKAARQKPPHTDPAARIHNMDEVVLCFDEAAAIAEASRCLACAGCAECLLCEQACKADAIRHEDKATEMKLEVGSIIMSPGFEVFDATTKPELGYGRYPNVLTSLDFERLLSASGPFEGHVVRPSDHKEPKKIAWLQCVGSREPAIGQGYCSYVCCMYATKQAIIAAEHLGDIETSIFFMDVRAQGKGFDRYYERAKNERGVRYVRSHISRITEDPRTHDLRIRYFDEAGELKEETFDLVVLSVGLKPHTASAELAEILDVELDDFGFVKPQSINPLTTNQAGVYTCGVIAGPKDIPETVTQAAGAAGQAAELLAPARGSQITETIYPDQVDVNGQEPRIGVFVCSCGINIAGVVNVAKSVEYAKSLPGVVHAENLLFSCSTDSLEAIGQAIKEHELNRVIVASCSPRTHEPLFRDTLARAGLNPYLFEMANIRDQCSWVHQQEPEEATIKANDLIRMSVARATMLEPLSEFKVKVDQRGLVIGGGVAGLTAALSLADQGFETTLVEKSDALGGMARKLIKTADGFDINAYVDELIAKAEAHPGLTILTGTEVESVSGNMGGFTATLKAGEGKEHIGCGAIIMAVGAEEHRPEEYLYGENEAVMTQLELDAKLKAGDELPQNVVMIQCVGSRDEEHPYCSRVCCTKACLNAVMLKEKNPQANVTIVYRDIRTYSTEETIYRAAREAGVRFVRYEPEAKPEVRADGDGLTVTVLDQGLKEKLILPADAVVLSAAVRPSPEIKEMGSKLKLPIDADGFFMEAHLKLRPVDFSAQGFFVAGTAHGPKFLDESIAQAKGAAARAAAVLSAEERVVGGEISVVDGEHCVTCLTCARTCPYDVPKVNEEGVVFIDPAACQGCGSCVSACPRKAITIGHHTDTQIVAKEMAL